MKAFSLAEERRVFNSLKRLFGAFIKRIKDGEVSRDQVAAEARKFIDSPQADNYLRNLVSKMTRRIRVDSANDWREAARKSGNGRYIHEKLKHEMDGPVGQRVWEIIAENVQYIKTVPQYWADYITKYALREALKGKRPEEVEAELRKIMPGHITKNLKCIARTECAKANAAIVEARAEACGINCYIWRCVKDERSRDSHIHMDGVLVFYSDPPSPEALIGEKPYGNYHAGNTFNCRCFQEPVIDVRLLPDTFKYYSAGKIHTTTRAAFIKKFGLVA